MNEKRKQWFEKYGVKIPLTDYVEKFCLPEHVERKISSIETGARVYFVGFDGRKTTYENLTEEEKQDWEEQIEKAKIKFHERYQGSGKEPGE